MIPLYMYLFGLKKFICNTQFFIFCKKVNVRMLFFDHQRILDWHVVWIAKHVHLFKKKWLLTVKNSLFPNRGRIEKHLLIEYFFWSSVIFVLKSDDLLVIGSKVMFEKLWLNINLTLPRIWRTFSIAGLKWHHTLYF